jgi:hypothetical protein
MAALASDSGMGANQRISRPLAMMNRQRDQATVSWHAAHLGAAPSRP